MVSSSSPSDRYRPGVLPDQKTDSHLASSPSRRDSSCAHNKDGFVAPLPSAMKRVQTKLAVLGFAAIAALSILAGLLLRGAYLEYVNLANFRRTTAISIAAYDLARDLTLERQYAYQASSFV